MKRYKRGIIRFKNSNFEITFNIYKEENNFSDETKFYIRYCKGYKEVYYNEIAKVWHLSENNIYP